jgi:farnesyl diphosphate synthase
MPVETIDRLAHELEAEARAVSADVDLFFSRLLAPTGDSRERFFEAMRHAAVGGGKRLRPLLTIAASRLFAIDRERALRVACAIEAIHVYSLIHDDLPCMDDAELRRGKATVHKAFGEAAAVLAGDSLHALAFEILAHPATHEDPWVRSDLVLELARAAGPTGMAGGQMMDLAAEGHALDLRSITRLQQLKTGALIEYSVEAACIMNKMPPDARTPYRG